MIFLKIFSAAVISAAALIALTGCSRSISAISGADAPAETTMATIEPVTASLLPDTSALPAAEGSYVHDSSGTLTAEETARVNSYCELLYKERLVNTAVVIADDIGGKLPYDYAADSYDAIYQSRGSGLLLLINNDKGDDCLYRTGSALRAIPDGAENIPFYWATKDIMSGDCCSAILRLLQLGESCPRYVFDNIGLLTDEELASLEASLSESKKPVYVLATTNGTDKSNEEICRSYFERRSEDGKGFMIMLDTKSNTVTVVSDADIPAEVTKAKSNADKLLKDGNAVGAVNEIVTAIG